MSPDPSESSYYIFHIFKGFAQRDPTEEELAKCMDFFYEKKQELIDQDNKIKDSMYSGRSNDSVVKAVCNFKCELVDITFLNTNTIVDPEIFSSMEKATIQAVNAATKNAVTSYQDYLVHSDKTKDEIAQGIAKIAGVTSENLLDKGMEEFLTPILKDKLN